MTSNDEGLTGKRVVKINDLDIIKLAERQMALDLCRAMHTDIGQITLHWAEEFLRDNHETLLAIAEARAALRDKSNG